MRRLAGAFTRRNLFAIAAGLLLGGLPVAGFNVWVGDQIERQAQWEISTAGRRALALAETRVGLAVSVVNQIAAKGATACTPNLIQSLRRTAFDAAPVKQVGLMAADGRVLCSEPELPIAITEVLSSQAVAEGIRLDVLRLADGQSMLRLRRTGAGSEPFAIIPSSLLLPQVSIDGSPMRGYAAILTKDGVVIGASGERPNPDAAIFGMKATSSLYGFKVEVAAPHEMLPAVHNSIRWLALAVSIIVIAALTSVVVTLMRRRPHDPVAELRAALKAGEFVPYYQPVVDIRSGQLRGAEVLVRWRKPDGSLELPSTFIPLAESSGLIRDLTRDLMRQVCRQAGGALGCRPALKVSFNLSAKQFHDDAIVKDVRNIFLNSAIRFSQVVLELTERDSIENFGEVRQVIAALQALGVRIAIDDVGTGHCGLSYMLKLGVDIIKIDKMFVDAIGTDRNSTTIVETLVDLAHNMRMDVVAEGVENFEQVMHLREVGIRSAQGYVFAPPLPGSAFLQLVQAIDPAQAAEAAAA
jgi:sensor c-di-GMP phosphodiesterase-like protein